MLVRPPPSTENASDSGACLDDRARWLALNWSAGGLAFRILVQKGRPSEQHLCYGHRIILALFGHGQTLALDVRNRRVRAVAADLPR